MNKKWLIYLVFGVILISWVSAYSYDKGPSLAFDAISNFYFKYAGWVDFFLLLVVFLIMVHKAMGDKFKDSSGNLLKGGIAFSLTIALSFWLKRMHLNLFKWITSNAIFFLFVVILFFYLAYTLINKIHDKRIWVSILLSYAVIYGFFRVFLGDQFEFILSEYVGHYLIYTIPLQDILYYLAMFCLIIGLMGLFFGKKSYKK